MNPLTEKRLPFADICAVTGIVPKRLRYWLDNNLIPLDADEERPEPGKHRRFSFLDALRIAIVVQLTPYGLTVEDAGPIADSIVSRKTGLLSMYSKTPPKAVALAWTGQVAVIWRDGDQYCWDTFIANQVSVDHDIFIVLRIDQIVLGVLGNLEELL